MSYRPSTFSIAAADPAAGEVGVAVASKFLAVGAVVPWARARVGAVATQAHANTGYGPEGLDLLEKGLDPGEVLDRLTEADEGRADRQAGIVAADGRSATYTGERCNPWAGGLTGENYAIQGNILTGGGVVDSMRTAFSSTTGRLGDRLLAALRAGDEAGGDSRGRQSAALLVVRDGGGYGGFNDRYLDLRVDDHPDPVPELIRTREIHRLYFDPPNANDAMNISPELAQELQRILRTTGDLEGDSTGSFDDPTREGLKRLFGRENLEERWRDDATIDRVALAYLRDRYPSIRT